MKLNLFMIAIKAPCGQKYLHQLRGKTMFRYHLKDSLLPGDGEKKG